MVLNSIFLSSPFAHRGLHGKEITENSRAAFQEAICKGFGIELDVQGLADSTPVVFHDDFLERLPMCRGK
jgi:Glycerophosphoryl diester phosphodiesterase